MKDSVSIQQFLDSADDTMFFHLDSDYEYTKEALDLGFQEFQECGSITIKEYFEKLQDYLNMFQILTTLHSEGKEDNLQ